MSRSRRSARGPSQVLHAHLPVESFIEGLTEALAEIRRLCVEALREEPQILADLELPPIPPVTESERSRKVSVVTCFFVRRDQLPPKVKYRGKSSPLAKLVPIVPADFLVRTARRTVAATFSEMFSEDQHDAVLKQIRQDIWNVLPAFNTFLEGMEVELISPMPESRQE